ncbi:hypothetical protein [Chryseobacterium viscerum]|nr:hypothetical protein [Chryseobacterium viscerum]
MIICTQSIPPVYLNFNVVDSSTGQDFFFSATPAFALKEMYFFKTKDVNRKDTIRPVIEGTAGARIFKLSLDIPKSQDTLIMKIGNKPEDKLVSKFKRTQEVCPVWVIDKIFVNNLELTATQGKYQIKKN